MATLPIPEHSRPDYSDDSRSERIDGRWLERPVPGEIHAQIQMNVAVALTPFATSKQGKALPEWSVTKPETAQWTDPDYMTPDVLLALPPISKTNRGHLIPPGFLAVEIASPDQTGLLRNFAAQRTRDPRPRLLKFLFGLVARHRGLCLLPSKTQRYHAWGVEHCWIIDPESRECFEYHGGNQIIIAREQLTAGEVRIPIANLFEGVEVS